MGKSNSQMVDNFYSKESSLDFQYFQKRPRLQVPHRRTNSGQSIDLPILTKPAKINRLSHAGKIPQDMRSIRNRFKRQKRSQKALLTPDIPSKNSVELTPKINLSQNIMRNTVSSQANRSEVNEPRVMSSRGIEVDRSSLHLDLMYNPSVDMEENDKTEEVKLNYHGQPVADSKRRRKQVSVKDGGESANRSKTTNGNFGVSESLQSRTSGARKKMLLEKSKCFQEFMEFKRSERHSTLDSNIQLPTKSDFSANNQGTMTSIVESQQILKFHDWMNVQEFEDCYKSRSEISLGSNMSVESMESRGASQTFLKTETNMECSLIEREIDGIPEPDRESIRRDSEEKQFSRRLYSDYGEEELDSQRSGEAEFSESNDEKEEFRDNEYEKSQRGKRLFDEHNSQEEFDDGNYSERSRSSRKSYGNEEFIEYEESREYEKDMSEEDSQSFEKEDDSDKKSYNYSQKKRKIRSRYSLTVNSESRRSQSEENARVSILGKQERSLYSGRRSEEGERFSRRSVIDKREEASNNRDSKSEYSRSGQRSRNSDRKSSGMGFSIDQSQKYSSRELPDYSQKKEYDSASQKSENYSKKSEENSEKVEQKSENDFKKNSVTPIKQTKQEEAEEVENLEIEMPRKESDILGFISENGDLNYSQDSESIGSHINWVIQKGRFVRSEQVSMEKQRRKSKIHKRFQIFKCNPESEEKLEKKSNGSKLFDPEKQKHKKKKILENIEIVESVEYQVDRSREESQKSKEKHVNVFKVDMETRELSGQNEIDFLEESNYDTNYMLLKETQPIKDISQIIERDSFERRKESLEMAESKSPHPEPQEGELADQMKHLEDYIKSEMARTDELHLELKVDNQSEKVKTSRNENISKATSYNSFEVEPRDEELSISDDLSERICQNEEMIEENNEIISQIMNTLKQDLKNLEMKCLEDEEEEEYEVNGEDVRSEREWGQINPFIKGKEEKIEENKKIDESGFSDDEGSVERVKKKFKESKVRMSYLDRKLKRLQKLECRRIRKLKEKRKKNKKKRLKLFNKSNINLEEHPNKNQPNLDNKMPQKVKKRPEPSENGIYLEKVSESTPVNPSNRFDHKEEKEPSWLNAELPDQLDFPLDDENLRLIFKLNKESLLLLRSGNFGQISKQVEFVKKLRESIKDKTQLEQVLRQSIKEVHGIWGKVMTKEPGNSKVIGDFFEDQEEEKERKLEYNRRLQTGEKDDPVHNLEIPVPSNDSGEDPIYKVSFKKTDDVDKNEESIQGLVEENLIYSSKLDMHKKSFNEEEIESKSVKSIKKSSSFKKSMKSSREHNHSSERRSKYDIRSVSRKEYTEEKIFDQNKKSFFEDQKQDDKIYEQQGLSFERKYSDFEKYSDENLQSLSRNNKIIERSGDNVQQDPSPDFTPQNRSYVYTSPNKKEYFSPSDKSFERENNQKSIKSYRHSADSEKSFEEKFSRQRSNPEVVFNTFQKVPVPDSVFKETEKSEQSPKIIRAPFDIKNKLSILKNKSKRRIKQKNEKKKIEWEQTVKIEQLKELMGDIPPEHEPERNSLSSSRKSHKRESKVTDDSFEINELCTETLKDPLINTLASEIKRDLDLKRINKKQIKEEIYVIEESAERPRPKKRTMPPIIRESNGSYRDKKHIKKKSNKFNDDKNDKEYTANGKSKYRKLFFDGDSKETKSRRSEM